MSDEIKWVAGFVTLVLTWAGRLLWVTHTDVQKIRADNPSWREMTDHVQKCSDDKDKDIKDLEDDYRKMDVKIEARTADLTKLFNDRHDQTQKILLDMAQKLGK